MKILKYSFLIAMILSVMSCSDKDRAFPEYDDLAKGAYGRLLDGPNGILDFEDPAGSGIDFTVEFYDENNGANVEKYEWTVEFPGFGPAQIASKSKGDFTPSATGLPGTTISFSYQDVLDALGMTLDDIVLGEQYTFIGTITKTDGSTFSATNTGGNVQSSSPFSGFFSFRRGIENLPCIHALSGVFDITSKATNQMAGIGWDDCGAEWSGQMTWVAEHDETAFGAGVYNVFTTDSDIGVQLNDFSFGSYYACYGVTDNGGMTNGTDGTVGNVRLNFDCNKGFFTGSSQWGEVYSLSNVVVNGPELKFNWTNDYGEGGEVTLTRRDGKNWPSDMRS
jgi:hypothetical protein